MKKMLKRIRLLREICPTTCKSWSPEIITICPRWPGLKSVMQKQAMLQKWTMQKTLVELSMRNYPQQRSTMQSFSQALSITTVTLQNQLDLSLRGLKQDQICHIHPVLMSRSQNRWNLFPRPLLLKNLQLSLNHRVYKLTMSALPPLAISHTQLRTWICQASLSTAKVTTCPSTSLIKIKITCQSGTSISMTSQLDRLKTQ